MSECRMAGLFVAAHGRGIIFIAEEYGKEYCHDQRIGRKYEPRSLPSGYHIDTLRAVIYETVYDGLRAERTDGGADAVRHHHE